MELVEPLQYADLEFKGGTEENIEPGAVVRSELLRSGLNPCDY
jgi:hypothetical protein